MDKEKLKLEVKINPYAGFCHGVTKAIRKAGELLDKGEEVYCIGPIVHNKGEVNRLMNKGLHVITPEDLDQLHGKTILIRAHGEPESTYQRALKNGNRIADASCSIVLNIQKKVREAFENGENIFLAGKPGHPEMIGIASQAKGQLTIIPGLEAVDEIAFPASISLFSQTTLSLSLFHAVAEKIRSKGITVKIHNTVCRQVSGREKQLAAFCKEYDVILFVAGKDSSNGKVLFDICQGANPRSYSISSTSEIQHEWFRPGERAGISGATSTPSWQMEEVKSFLEAL